MKDPGGFPGIFYSSFVGSQAGSFLGKMWNWPLSGKAGRDGRERQATPDGRWWVWEAMELTFRACIGGCRMRKSQHPATRTFKVSVEAFNGAHSHPHPDSLNTTSLCQRSILKNSSTVGSVHSGGGLSAQGRGWEPSACLGAARMSTSCHLLQQHVRKTQCQFYTEQSKGSNIFKISLTLHYDEWKNRVVILEYFLVTKTTHLQTFCSTFFLTVHL